MFGNTDPSIAEMREAVALSLMENAELLAPLFDAADGMKADLLARGWSPAIVDYLAGAWLSAMLAKAGAA
ncbi:hypothetical protein [Streptomyces sp. NPDC057557]|uniref:hypothetical protein n=1 Tax=Streptomyces sp. NPDC057557 TaxID=3346167 RepID=UPI0036D1A4E4